MNFRGLRKQGKDVVDKRLEKEMSIMNRSRFSLSMVEWYHRERRLGGRSCGEVT